MTGGIDRGKHLLQVLLGSVLAPHDVLAIIRQVRMLCAASLRFGLGVDNLFPLPPGTVAELPYAGRHGHAGRLDLGHRGVPSSANRREG